MDKGPDIYPGHHPPGAFFSEVDIFFLPLIFSAQNFLPLIFARKNFVPLKSTSTKIFIPLKLTKREIFIPLNLLRKFFHTPYKLTFKKYNLYNLVHLQMEVSNDLSPPPTCTNKQIKSEEIKGSKVTLSGLTRSLMHIAYQDHRILFPFTHLCSLGN